jgi:CrcB protein
VERKEQAGRARRGSLRPFRLPGRHQPASRNGSHPAAIGDGDPAPGRGSRPGISVRRAAPRGRLGGQARPAILAAIAAGGALGAPARFLLGKAVHVHPGSFPWATFWINLSGSFALGLLLTFILERWPPSRFVRPFAAVGFIGAYTTFSTFGVEADLLISAGRVVLAVVYVVGSLAGGLVAVYLGISLGRLWPGGARP